MPFYYGKRSAGICVVLGPKTSSTYSSEYASGFFDSPASHLPAAPSPRNEGLLGQTPSPRATTDQRAATRCLNRVFPTSSIIVTSKLVLSTRTFPKLR